MKRIVRDRIDPAYSLHDMNITNIEISENTVVFKTQSGILRAKPQYNQVDGYVEFLKVQWDFSYVYLLNFSGNIGGFTGEKLFFKDFIERYPSPCFTVMDETYGYNSTAYTGYLTINGNHCECFIEIYHEGDMLFIEE